jgi:hypothetical protein
MGFSMRRLSRCQEVEEDKEPAKRSLFLLVGALPLSFALFERPQSERRKDVLKVPLFGHVRTHKISSMRTCLSLKQRSTRRL